MFACSAAVHVLVKQFFCPGTTACTIIFSIDASRHFLLIRLTTCSCRQVQFCADLPLLGKHSPPASVEYHMPPTLRAELYFLHTRTDLFLYGLPPHAQCTHQ